MINLSTNRLKGKPFRACGVDFCWPYLVSYILRELPVKSYVAVFVCFASRTFQLELVDLSTDVFFNAFKGFAGR